MFFLIYIYMYMYIYKYKYKYKYKYISWNFHSLLSWWAWRLDLSCDLGSPCFPIVLHVREVVYHLHLGRNYWFTSSGGQRCGLSHWWEKQQWRCCWWLLLKRGCFAIYIYMYICIYITVNYFMGIWCGNKLYRPQNGDLHWENKVFSGALGQAPDNPRW